MTKVLVTGLGIANELGLCDSCNLNFSWLANNPSTLLWADEICIPKSAFKKQMNVNETKQDKTINMFLNMANKAGFIKQVDLTGIYKKTVSEDIYENVLKDSQKLIKTFPKEIKKGLDGDPFEIMIGDDGYCTAMLSAVYSGIKVAKDLDANCMFSKKDHTLLKYLYGLEANQNGGSVVNNIYDEIFSVYMPEGMALHNYSFSEEERCKKCVHYEACKGNYLTETEKTLKKMLAWREYDELQNAKKEIDKIIRIKNDIQSINDYNDVIKEFQEKQDRINRNINKRFPQIERWTKMTTVIATPITIASGITGNTSLAVGSAVIAGIAQVTNEMMDVYKSKNRWVGFVNEMKNM